MAAHEQVSPFARRAVAAVVALGCAGVLGVAAIMTPSATGLGTHRQLNMPECGWITIMDVPCMTCGMTTSFSHAVRGDLLRSFLAQPFGFVLALATAMAFIVSLHVALTGSQLAQPFARLWNARAAWLIALFAAGAWVFKVLSYKGIA